MNGYPGGYYNLDITEFVATDEWLESHGVESAISYKDYLLSFPENSIAYDRSIHVEQMEKARVIDSESAGVAASYDNNRASEDKLTHPGIVVKNESSEAMDIVVDSDTESVAPAPLSSERSEFADSYLKYSERVTDRETLDFLNKQKTITTYREKNNIDYQDCIDDSVSNSKRRHTESYWPYNV